jgi:hypothetical protein
LDHYQSGEPINLQTQTSVLAPSVTEATMYNGEVGNIMKECDLSPKRRHSNAINKGTYYAQDDRVLFTADAKR